jgi:hypothetical protein
MWNFTQQKNGSFIQNIRKVKQSHYRPEQALRVPGVEVPRFQDNRHMKVVSLSALHTGRLYSPGNIPGNNFC